MKMLISLIQFNLYSKTKTESEFCLATLTDQFTKICFESTLQLILSIDQTRMDRKKHFSNGHNIPHNDEF